MDFFKDFIVKYCHNTEEVTSVSEDERLTIGCLLIEYLMPLMEDSYFLEQQILQLFLDLNQLKKIALINLVFQIFDICFNDEYLKKWTVNLMKSCCVRLL